MPDRVPLTISLPPPVADVLRVLRDGGGEAVLVGGCVRDLVRGERPADWDVATSLPPDEVARRFPDASWTNPFGTVTVRAGEGARRVEVTTYRTEAGYRDGRRPERVAWSPSLEQDLARRDFTINAMAWRPLDLLRGSGELVDPFGGADDLDAGLLRAVGDPDQRIAEDALRLVRAVRFATRFGLRLEPATEEAIRRHAGAASTLSGERVRDEVLRILGAERPPSAAFVLMERLGLLAVLLPELAALRGVPQAKALPGDALDHSLRTMDALPPEKVHLRLAGLVHDLGKATTLAGGHFIGHELEGERLATALLGRLRVARAPATRVGRLVRHHMFVYEPEWTDAAVRRFVRRVGVDLLDDLLALRAADDAASGMGEPARGRLSELRRRIDAVLGTDPLEHRDLAVDGNDLMAALGLPAGPMVGDLLARLLEAVLEQPALNRRDVLLALARDWVAAGASAHRDSAPESGRPETAAE